jgi:hypothetical protein
VALPSSALLNAADQAQSHLANVPPTTLPTEADHASEQAHQPIALPANDAHFTPSTVPPTGLPSAALDNVSFEGSTHLPTGLPATDTHFTPSDTPTADTFHFTPSTVPPTDLPLTVLDVSAGGSHLPTVLPATATDALDNVPPQADLPTDLATLLTDVLSDVQLPEQTHIPDLSAFVLSHFPDGF